MKKKAVAKATTKRNIIKAVSIGACAAMIAAAVTPAMADGVTADTEKAEQTKTATVTSNGQSTDLNLQTDNKEDINIILGDSWYYGVVADTFNFNGESETNFAVKNFRHQGNGSGGQTGVTDKGEGSKKAYFVAGEVDSPFMVKGIGAEITTPEGNSDLFRDSTNGGAGLKFNTMNKDIIEEYIDDLREDAKTQSERLAKEDSVENYDNLPQNQMTIDITPAGENTVYINADKWDGLKNMLEHQASGVKIVKNAGQKIVFNFPDSKSVTTQKIEVKQDGRQYDGASLANQSTPKTNDIQEDIIFNAPKAESVALNDTTGIILAPNAEVKCYGVDGGWVNCETMANACEWHAINGKLPEARVLGAKRLIKKSYGPAVPVTPDTPNAPKDEDKPQEPDTPTTPDEPQEPETPDQPDIPDTPNAPDIPATPENPTTPNKPNTPDTPDQPSVPDTPETPDKPTTPATPEEPNTPELPVTPEKPSTPEQPGIPDVPETPVTPDVPDQVTPKAPASPVTPVIPTTPTTTDNTKPKDETPTSPNTPTVTTEEKANISIPVPKTDGTASVKTIGGLVIPQTGDTSIIGYIAIIGAAAVILISAGVLASRKHKKNHQ